MAEKGDLLKKIREQLRFTQAEMGKALGGYDRGTYKNWEIREPPEDIWKKAVAMTNGQSLVREAASPYSVLRKLAVGPMIELPQFGTVHAGSGDTEIYDDTLYVPAQFGYDDYGAFLVEGESMLPILWPGDIAIVRTQKTPKANDINLIVDASGHFALKWASYVDGQWQCTPHNPRFDGATFEEGTFATGYLVGYYRDDGETMEIKHRRAGNLFDRP